MKEIICMHIGQAGIQLGSAIWELICAEHGVSVDGSLNFIDDFESHQGLNRFFYETEEKQIVPRCLFVDLEPSVADEVRQGCYKRLFGHETIVSGFEDAASIFSRGYFSFGRFFINDIMTKINRQIELCDTPQAFIFTHSSGGGTGSGLFSLMVEEMEDFTKIMKMDICIHPSFPISPIVVEPYNSVLTSHYTMDNTDITFLMDNEALYNLAYRHLEQEQLNYHLINRITAQMLSSVTAATRFEGQSTTITEYLHNLVPYPRIHFPICSISPIASPNKQIHYPNTIYTITKDALSHDFQMIRCVPMDGKFMSCCLMYRGNVSPADVYSGIERLKCYDRMQFVDWSPTGVKITICNRPCTTVQKSGLSYTTRSLTMLCNNSAIVDALLQNTFRFHILFKKRAFVHWFIGEGMEEEEFKDSLENIACLVKDYEECAYPTKLLQNPSVIEGIDEQPKEAPARRFSNLEPKQDEDVQKYNSIEQRKPSFTNENEEDNNVQENNENINNHGSNNDPAMIETSNYCQNNQLVEEFCSDEPSCISSFSTIESIYDDRCVTRDNIVPNFAALDDLEVVSPAGEEAIDHSKSSLNRNLDIIPIDEQCQFTQPNNEQLCHHKIHTLNDSCYLSQ